MRQRTRLLYLLMGRLVPRELTNLELSHIVLKRLVTYSTSLNPAYTGKVKPGKMDQKDYDGEDKKGGDAKKEQKDYDGANKKGDVKKEKNYGGDKKEYDVKKEKNYDGDKKEYDVKKEKNYDGDKKEYDVKESGKPDGYGSGSSNWDQEYDCVQRELSILAYFQSFV